MVTDTGHRPARLPSGFPLSLCHLDQVSRHPGPPTRARTGSVADVPVPGIGPGRREPHCSHRGSVGSGGWPSQVARGCSGGLEKSGAPFVKPPTYYDTGTSTEAYDTYLYEYGVLRTGPVLVQMKEGTSTARTLLPIHPHPSHLFPTSSINLFHLSSS